MNIWSHINRTLQNRRAQLLLPAVLLLPLFVLVIYLLTETTKVSIAKVRHQFALDNAAYTQMTTVSVFLNAVGLLNGPLPYRVFGNDILQPDVLRVEPYVNPVVVVLDVNLPQRELPYLQSPQGVVRLSTEVAEQ